MSPAEEIWNKTISEYNMTFFNCAHIILLWPNRFRLFMGGSADTPSPTDSCPSSLTQWWTWSWELVTTTLLSDSLSRIWWKVSQFVYGASWGFFVLPWTFCWSVPCVCVLQAQWRWPLLMTTQTSCSHRDTHCHASLWLEEMAPWRTTVASG